MSHVPAPRGLRLTRRSLPLVRRFRRRPSRLLHPFLLGVLEGLGLPLAFAALGLSAWAVAQPAGPAAPAYPRVLVDSLPPVDDPPRSRPSGPEPAIWLVDAFNVLQVALLGGQDRSAWWTRPHREALLERVAAFQPGPAGSPGPEAGTARLAGAGSPVQVWLVFDGPRPAEAPAEPPFLVFAPSADEWILARIRASDAPERIAVVSADRRLSARARARGARVVSPGAFLERCPVRGESASV